MFLENYDSEAKRLWITLFDHLDDDTYDGDFTYDDAEVPRILLEYRAASDRPHKTSHRVTSSAAKGARKAQPVVTSTTHTTVTTTIQRTSEVVPVRTQHITRSTRSQYVPRAVFEIGEEPTNSTGFNARNLEAEARKHHEDVLNDLKALQENQFADINSRVEALGFLDQAHQELLGSNEEDKATTKRLQTLSREIDSEIASAKSKISCEVTDLKNENKRVGDLIKDTENNIKSKTQENKKLQDKLDIPEDLSEKGFSKEAKDIRVENGKLKTNFNKDTSILLSERDERNKILDGHSQTVQDYNDTIFKYYNMLLKAEQARKIHLDDLNDVDHQVSKFEDENSSLDKRIQLSDIDVDTLKQTVESLRKDLSTNDTIYKDHIAELSEMIVDQNREIGLLRDEYNAVGGEIRQLQTEIDKQKVDLSAHEQEMDEIKKIDYERRVSKWQEDLKNADEIRRKHQDELENAHEKLSTKIDVFAKESAQRKTERDQMLGRVASSLDKLKSVQENINEILKAIDKLENKQVSDANKDIVGASLDHELENLNLKLRWANDERDVTMKDLDEAIKLAKAKEDEIREQEKWIRELLKWWWLYLLILSFCNFIYFFYYF